ncbi:MAG: protein-(glutamine-N5) methyltransferase, release factor-specific [Phycisphaerae bacterium]|nr:protein-(glutamine-N5) methyltransferase, release factor-specific [Phycisphaerae bacterium]
MTSAPANKVWTTRELLDWMSGAFKTAAIDSPRRSAEELLAHVIGCERMRLYMDIDRPASPAERDELRGLLRRALAHEPLQYLIGQWAFFGMPIKCDARALIPRPETETLVEHVLQHGRREDATPLRRIADICTGTGCIALALAKHLREAEVVATDVSADALALAQENAEILGLSERIDFREGDLLAPLGEERFDLITANPPYISDREWEDVEPNVKDHEPTLALRGGGDGLDLVRRLIDRAWERLEAGGWLVMETASSHAHEARDLCDLSGRYEATGVLDDLAGLPRVVVARRKA